MTIAEGAPEHSVARPSGYAPLKRSMDIAGALLALVLFSLPMLLIALAVRWESSGPILYWSVRAGRNGKPFRMPKFRSMRMGTPCVASRTLENPGFWVTPIGRVLRRTSLDELPQFWSVLKGDMSLIGPHALLMEEAGILHMRQAAGVSGLRPGISGWAQVNGRDTLTAEEKIHFDREYLHYCSFSFDLMILLKTVRKVIFCLDVNH